MGEMLSIWLHLISKEKVILNYVFYILSPHFIYIHICYQEDDYLSAYVNTWKLLCKFQVPKKHEAKHIYYVGKKIIRHFLRML